MRASVQGLGGGSFSSINQYSRNKKAMMMSQVAYHESIEGLFTIAGY
jgi:hypothetical protein